ncbi:cell envelope integrity EipB family protein [Salinarimonas sp.]|uniref:cell envelope integrity EipB family protein n=1 Tax=Salinarimonas sp. TaxID=2766526 RepID=UPI0032D92381
MRALGPGSVLTALVLLAGGLAEASPLTPHRAVYDLALAPGSETLSSAQGRIAIEFYGSPCEGYTTRLRQVTALQGRETPSRTLDSNSATFEEADASVLRFRSETRADGITLEEVEGSAERTDGETVIALDQPEDARLVVEGAPMFPTQHIVAMIETAQAGAPLLATRVYDGTGDGRTVYDTLAILGRALPEGAADAVAAPLADLARWPVRLSYFEPGPGERTPAYVIGFTLYENGVSSDLVFEFEDFTLTGRLSALELLEVVDCAL